MVRLTCAWFPMVSWMKMVKHPLLPSLKELLLRWVILTLLMYARGGYLTRCVIIVLKKPTGLFIALQMWWQFKQRHWLVWPAISNRKRWWCKVPRDKRAWINALPICLPTTSIVVTTQVLTPWLKVVRTLACVFVHKSLKTMLSRMWQKEKRQRSLPRLGLLVTETIAMLWIILLPNVKENSLVKVSVGSTSFVNVNSLTALKTKLRVVWTGQVCPQLFAHVFNPFGLSTTQSM